MELTEKVETINNQLISLFGIDSITGRAMYRVVWSEDQFEKRLMKFSDAGIELPFPEVREVPKYRQWIQKRYVLEHLVLVPEVDKATLPTSRYSYEPLYTFMDKHEDYAPPTIELAKLVIDCILAATGKESLGPKYQDPEVSLEAQDDKINRLYEDLYGNETPVGDALAYGEGITVPEQYINVKKES